MRVFGLSTRVPTSTVRRGLERLYLACDSFLRQDSQTVHDAPGFVPNPMAESRTSLTLDELNCVATLVYGVMTPTPQYAWPTRMWL